MSVRAPRSIFWLNGAKSGAENLGELGDPRATCIAMNAGEMKSDDEAKRLGIMQYLYGGGSGPQAQARGMVTEAPDPKALSDESARGSEAVRRSQMEHEQLRPLSVEERSYVENAVVSGAPVTESDRATAGKLGAQFTGPSPAEITASGGNYQEAADKAAQAQGLTEAPKPDEPKPPESESESTPRTTPPRVRPS